jgi:hypothetical protein
VLVVDEVYGDDSARVRVESGNLDGLPETGWFVQAITEDDGPVNNDA